MKKVFTGFLIVVILICVSFIILWTLSNGSENNFFNRQYRAQFAISPAVRQLLDLHFDGDGKSDYLGRKFAAIDIEVDQMQGIEIPSNALNLLAEKIHEITGKKVNIKISDVMIPYQDFISDSELDALVHKYQNTRTSSDTARLYLLFASQSTDDNLRLGVTHKEFGIVLYTQELRELTAKNPQTLPEYVESTALHEFGHQLGLDHNLFSDCLMQKEVDQSSIFRENSQTVITNFCNYEKQIIEHLKSSF